eukprot:c20776_g1_i7.p1 GENE.c20776_g1_i7~~c20776_g1_i7.p1  ORF type:complete len:314 (-),score=60.38 c20776_g1_i7:72-1013(-)
MFAVEYTTYNETDFDEMAKIYHGPTGWGCGYDKPNSTCTQPGCANPRQSTTRATLVNLYRKPNSCDFALQLSLPANLVSYYGAPAQIWNVLSLRDDAASSVAAKELIIDLQLFNKTATRLPESMMLTMPSPIKQSATATWFMDKLNEWVRPEETIENGNVWQHAVWRGVACASPGDTKAFLVESFDAPIVAVGATHHVYTPFLKELAPVAANDVTGLAWNLFNNIWNTNYPLWYPFLTGDENIRFRFIVSESAQIPRTGLNHNAPSDVFPARSVPLQAHVPVIDIVVSGSSTVQPHLILLAIFSWMANRVIGG